MQALQSSNSRIHHHVLGSYFRNESFVKLFYLQQKKEGEHMSLEAIKQITLTEAALKQRKAEAIAAAKKMVADTEQAGKDALQTACADAEVKAKELLTQAEEQAAARAAEIAVQSRQECAALCSAAENKLDEAAALIVRRVVSS